MVSDLNKLGIALKSLDAMNLGTVGVNLANVEAYRTALKGLSVEQSVFALASKGATEEQIRQILVTNQATAEDVEAAMAKAGLTTATQALTQAEMVEMATKTGVAKATAEELLSKIGITATETGQIPVKKQVTRAMLEQAVASGTLTKAEASQIATMLGLNAVETTNIGITNVLTASFTKLWAVITAHPIGAILTAIGAVAVGAIAYINKTNKEAEEALVEAHENAKQALDDTKNSLSDDKSELQSVNSELETTKERLKEISSIGAPTLTEQNELTKLSTANAQLEAQQTLLENNIKLKQKAAALDAKELLGTQVEMEYSSILDDSSITSATESYSYDDHAKYQASNLKNAYNIYMKALRDGDVKKQQLAQELIDASAGDSAVLTSELLEIVESFKYDDGTIIEGYEDLYNEYMGMIYNLQSLTNPDTFLEIAKSVTTGKGIDYEKAISEAYNLAYEGNFDVASLNQDFVKALADAGIDESTISYIFKLKQQEYQLLVDKINSKYDSSKVQYTYWDGEGKIHYDYEKENSAKADVEKVNQELNEYARENPIEFQLVSSYDENFILLDKYIEEEKKKATNSADYVGDYVENAIQRIYDEAKVKSDTFNNEITVSFEDIFNSSDFADVKQSLLELAKSGELTTATLTSTEEYNNLLSKTGLLAGDAKDRILDMLSAQDKLSAASQGLDNLKSAYEEFKDEEIGFVTAETLSSLPDAFKELKGFDLFSQIVGDPTSGTKKIQQAFNDIAKEYLVEQRTLTGLSRENMNSYIANIKQMGITNAEEVVNTVLTNLESTNTMIEQAEKEYIQCLNDGTAADLDHVQTVMAYNQKLASALGASYKKDYETWCELLKLKSEAYNDFVERIGGSYDSELSTIQNMMNNGKDMGTSNIADALAAEAKLRDAEYQLKKQSEILKIDMTPIDTNFGGGYSPNTGSDKGKKDSSSAKTFNWVEILLDKLSKKTDELKEKFEEAFSLKKAKTAFKKAISQITKEIKANEKAVAFYEKKANNVKLSSKYKKLVDSGALKIEDVTDEALAKQIEAYQDYKDKADACRDTIDDLRDSYTELAETFYNKPLELREEKLEKIDTALQLLDSKIENASTPGERNKYAKKKEELYKNEYASYETAESTAKSNLGTTKKAIDQKSDKALKGLTTAQKKKITGAVAKGMEITDEMVDFDSLTEDALAAVIKYNESLKAYGDAVADRKQAEQDLQSNLRENMQVKIDNKSNYINMLEAKYENIDENSWKSRNANLDKQIAKTKEMYELMIAQETDVFEKERLRAEMNKKIADLTEQQVENIRTYYQNIGELADARKNERSSQQDYYEATGLDSKSTRLSELDNTSRQAKIAAKAKLEEANTYDKDSKEYASAMSDYWKLMTESSKADYEMWKEASLSGVNNALEAVSREIDTFNKELELDDTKGIERDETDYTTLINNENKAISINEDKIETLKKKQQKLLANGGSTDSTIYKELQSEIESCEDAIYNAEKAQIEYNKAIANLPLDRLEKALELIDAIANKIESENDLKQKKGIDLSIEDYQAGINAIDERRKNALDSADIEFQYMLEALASPNNVSQAGFTAEQHKTNFNNKMAEANQAEMDKIDLGNTMRDDVFWRDVERKMDNLQHKEGILSGIGDLISDKMKFDSDGKLTDLGRTSIAIDVAGFENSRAQVKTFEEEMQILNDLYAQGKYTEQEYNEKFEEIQENIIDATKNTMSFTDAIVDMAKAMAENELDALNKIIEKRKKALQAKKSYYDYDKNLRNQNKQISALEAEIAAMQNVDDAYTKAELARKQAELDELKEARDDTIIEHNYEIQSNGLDELQEDLQTKYDEYIDGIGRNFESIEGIVGNAKGMFAKSFNAISDSMYSLLQSYGIDPNSTGITWTKISDTEGFATGGIIRSNYTGQDDRILVRVNPDETILTKKFTDLLPDAVQAMNNFNMLQPTIPQPIIPNFKGNTGTSTTNIDTLIRVDGNVDKTVVGDLKELANDLAKKTNLLDKSYQYTTSAMVKDAKSAGHKRMYH